MLDRAPARLKLDGLGMEDPSPSLLPGKPCPERNTRIETGPRLKHHLLHRVGWRHGPDGVVDEITRNARLQSKPATIARPSRRSGDSSGRSVFGGAGGAYAVSRAKAEGG